MYYIIKVSHICYSGPYPRGLISYWCGTSPGSKPMAVLFESEEDASNATCELQNYEHYRCLGVYKVEQDYSTQVIVKSGNVVEV
jgi:hypothetical protein